MVRQIHIIFCLLLLSSGLSMGKTASNLREVKVEQFAPSAYGIIDIDLSFQFGVDFVSDIGYDSPKYFTLSGVPVVPGFLMEISYSQNESVLPIAVGFEANLSHAAYGNRSDYGIDKGIIVDRIPLRAYVRTNTSLYLGVGMYDSILLRGRVKESDNLYLNMLDNSCFNKHLYGLTVIMGLRGGRFGYAYYLNLGFCGQLNPDKIAEINRAYTSVSSEMSFGMRLSYTITSNYSPKRKVKPTFKF